MADWRSILELAGRTKGPDPSPEDIKLLQKVTVKQISSIIDYREAGMSADEILNCLKDGVLKREALANAKQKQDASKDALFKKRMAQRQAQGSVTNAGLDDITRRLKQKEAEQKALDEQNVRKSRFEFFQQLEKSRNNEDVAKQVRQERAKELAERKQAHEDKRARAAAAGTPDFDDSDEERALAEEETKLKSSEACMERRVKLNKQAKKPTVAPGSELRGTENDEEVWGEGVGADAQQVARAAVWSAALDAEAALDMSALERASTEKERVAEDLEMGLSERDVVALAAAREAERGAAGARADALRREQASMKDGAPSQSLFHGIVTRFQNLARRADLVVSMPRKMRQAAEQVAHEYDKALGYSPIECERRRQERVAHLEMAARRAEMRLDARMCVWADTFVRASSATARANMMTAAKKADNDAGYSASEAVHMQAERLRHVELAWLRAADEKAASLASPADALAFRAFARRADHMIRFPLPFRLAADAAADKDDSEALPKSESDASKAARALHRTLAITRGQQLPVHPFGLKAAMLVRLPKSAPQEELERMRSQDGEMDLTADQCISRAAQRRALVEAAKALASDEMAEAAESDVSLFRLAAVRADALVRLPLAKQQSVRATYMDSLLHQRGASKAEAAQAGGDWDRHLTMAAERFKPSPDDLAALADILVASTIQERVAKEQELRAADGRAQEPHEALHNAALRAHHMEMAALRRLDCPAGKAADETDAWMERARLADLLTQRFPTIASQDKELARLSTEDAAFLSKATAAAAATARAEHVAAARRRQRLLTLPLEMVNASMIASQPRRKQLSEEAKLVKADEEAGLTDEEIIAAELRRKLALYDARARLVGEEAEMADLRGNPATFRVEAIRADRSKWVAEKERALLGAAAARVDSILGIPDDQKAEQKELRAEHAKEADARVLLQVSAWSHLDKAAQQDALDERKAEEEGAEVADDVRKDRDAERRKLLTQAMEDADGRAMWLARMTDHRRTVEIARLRHRDELLGLPEAQVEERAAKLAAQLAKAQASLAAAAKDGKTLEVPASEARVAAAAGYTPARRNRHGDVAGLDLDSVAAQLAFAARADDILQMPSGDQEAAVEADRAKDAAILGIGEPEIVSRSSERARHRELARVRRDDELTSSVEGAAAAAWRSLAREADILIRLAGAKKKELEAAIDARELKLSKEDRDAAMADRDMHMQLAEERKRKCSETAFGAAADGLVRMSKGALAAQERRLEQEDAEAGLGADDIAINAARRKRELSLARRRLASEKADPVTLELDGAGLAEYRAEALRADKLIRLPKSVREEEDVGIDAAAMEAGVAEADVDARRRARAQHLALADKRYRAHRARIGLPVPTDAELQQRLDDAADSDLEPYVGDVAETSVIEKKEKERETAEMHALEKQAEELGQDAGELERLLEADAAQNIDKERAKELRAEEDEEPEEEEDQEAKMKRLLAEEDEWETEAGMVLQGGNDKEEEIPADDTASFGGGNAVTAQLEAELGVGENKVEEFDTTQKVVVDDGADDEEVPEDPMYETLRDLRTPIIDYDVAMDKEFVGSEYVTPTFSVTKYTPDAGWAVRGNLKRVWKVDFWNRELVNMTPQGKVQKSHKSSKILQLEKNLSDSRRLRMMMFDANHSYELLFETAEQRERFFECANSLRPALRVYCPSLVPEGSLYATSKLFKEPSNEAAGVARINSARKPWERVTLWTGTWDMGGRAPPPIESANTAEGSPLEFWMPRDKYDVYVCGVQGASYRKDEKEWFRYVQAFLGGGYVTLASLCVADLLLIVCVRKKSLLKVTNVEGTSVPNLRSSGDGKEVGGVAISLRYLETSMLFLNLKLAQAPDKVRLRNTNFKEIVETTSLAVKDCCISTQFDHAFILGNFGYRHKLDAKATAAAIASERFEDIIAKDELADLLKGKSFADGFKDASELLFKPTFPLRVGSDEYSGEEPPSYPDRIIVRSSQHVDKCLVPDLYVSAEEVTISQHAPVFASFALQCRRPFASIFHPLTKPPCRIVLHSASVSHEGLQPLNKPQLTMWGTFCDGPALSKPLKKQTEWKKEDLPMLIVHVHHREILRLQSFVCSYRDQSFKDKKKGYRGSCNVPVKEVVDAAGKPVKVMVPLVYMGGRLGNVTFVMQLIEMKSTPE